MQVAYPVRPKLECSFILRTRAWLPPPLPPPLSLPSGLSFGINTEQGPAGRSAGSLAWAGLFNAYFWVDPNKRVTGTILTQLLPFADDQVLKLFAKFESGLYAAIA